jgi:endosialidase-like protein
MDVSVRRQYIVPTIPGIGATVNSLSSVNNTYTTTSNKLPVYNDASLAFYYEASTNSLRTPYNIFSEGEIAAYVDLAVDGPTFWDSLHYLREVSLGTSFYWDGAYLEASAGSGGGSDLDASVANWNTGYTHSQDNTQAHTDYLINNGNDTTSGHLTADAFRTPQPNTNTEYSIFTRAGGNNAFYAQQVDGSGLIASFRYGNSYAGSGAEAMAVKSNEIVLSVPLVQIGSIASPLQITVLGANSQTVSSEILFGDGGTGVSPYNNGMGIRYNSTLNTLNIDDNYNSTNDPLFFVARDTGYVGIASGTAGALLHLGGAKDSPDILLSNINTGLTDSGSIRFKEETAGADRFTIQHNGATNMLSIDTESVSNALSVARTSGYVGIHTTTPSQNLSVDHWMDFQNSGTAYGEFLGIDSINGLKLGFDSTTILTLLSTGATINGAAIIDGITTQNSADRSGLLEINQLTTTGWSGIQIKRSVPQLWSLMASDTAVGMYDDTNSDWIWHHTENADINLYYAGSAKFGTTSTGVNVTGAITTDGMTTSEPITVDEGAGMATELSDGKLGFTRASANYIWADTAGGYLYFGANGNSIGTAYALLKVGTSSCQLRYGASGASTKLETTSTGVTVTGALTATGEVTAYYSSDKRLKSNIKDFTALDIIAQLKPKTFNWNDKAKALNPSKDDRKNYGLIAQEVEKVIPEIVHKSYEKYKSLDYVELVPILLQGMKEQQEMIDELKTEINKLKNVSINNN